jgi:hypothetical protein
LIYKVTLRKNLFCKIDYINDFFIFLQLVFVLSGFIQLEFFQVYGAVYDKDKFSQSTKIASGY